MRLIITPVASKIIVSTIYYYLEMQLPKIGQ